MTAEQIQELCKCGHSKDFHILKCHNVIKEESSDKESKQRIPKLCSCDKYDSSN